MTSSIQLLRSTTYQERPLAGNLLEGQPAVNLNASEPGLFFKATDGSTVKIGPVAVTKDGLPPNSVATGSTGNSLGELWFDSLAQPGLLKIFDGQQWQPAAVGGVNPTISSNLQVGENITVGGDVNPETDLGSDLGSPSLRWGNIYTGDLNLSNRGKTNSVDGTWGDWTLQEGENDLFLINNRTGGKFRVVLEPV